MVRPPMQSIPALGDSRDGETGGRGGHTMAGRMLAAKLHLFTQHSRSWQANRYVYPVLSRRSRGLSIGVNLNPDKVCNFDCIYCCVDRTSPPTVTEVDLDVLRDELD